MNTRPAACFNSFAAACDYVDEHTTPDNPGSLLIEQTAPNLWAVYPWQSAHAPATLDTPRQPGR